MGGLGDYCWAGKFLLGSRRLLLGRGFLVGSLGDYCWAGEFLLRSRGE